MLSGKPNLEACKKIVEGFYKHGVVAIKDPRVDERKNQEFLDMMARYFKKRSEQFYRGDKLEDCFPEHGYQVGVTPELVERAREHEDTIGKHFNKERVLSAHTACHSSTPTQRRKMEILLANRRTDCQGQTYEQ
jgi:hypothetical protein